MPRASFAAPAARGLLQWLAQQRQKVPDGSLRCTICAMIDPYNLQRFVDARERVYGNVLAELSAGGKSSHWMWFIFPQLKGLGRSGVAKQYGISSLAEAVAHIKHPVLGKRLLECTRLMLSVQGKSARQILGTPDDLKFRSCMTLFRATRPDLPDWDAALAKYFGGVPDEATTKCEPATKCL